MKTPSTVPNLQRQVLNMFIPPFYPAKRIETNRAHNLHVRHKGRNIQHNWGFHPVKESLTRVKADICCYYQSNYRSWWDCTGFTQWSSGIIREKNIFIHALGKRLRRFCDKEIEFYILTIDQIKGSRINVGKILIRNKKKISEWIATTLRSLKRQGVLSTSGVLW